MEIGESHDEIYRLQQELKEKDKLIKELRYENFMLHVKIFGLHMKLGNLKHEALQSTFDDIGNLFKKYTGN